MILRKMLVVATVTTFVAAAACDKKDSAPPAPVASAVGNVSAVSYSAKLPAKGSHAIVDKAIRGGAGDSRPSVSSKHLSETSTDRQMRKASAVDKIDCTAPKMDNAAECDGENLYFCDDNALWVVGCNAEAKFGGAAEGSCFEGDKFIDCLGCAKADDGSEVCCDFQMTQCCDKDGNCYSPKS